MRAAEDIDPAELARDVGKLNAVIGVPGLPKTQQTIKHSASTQQRCKTITMYIKKLQDDISMLTEMKASLGEVRLQLEKEKVDTFIAERISKEALAAFEIMTKTDMMQKLLDEIANAKDFPKVQVNPNGIPDFTLDDDTMDLDVETVDVDEQANYGAENGTGEEALMASLRRDMEEPPLPPPLEEIFDPNQVLLEDIQFLDDGDY